MKKCFICKRDIQPSEKSYLSTIELGGPNEGCSEFAVDEMVVDVCEDCWNERGDDSDAYAFTDNYYR